MINRTGNNRVVRLLIHEIFREPFAFILVFITQFCRFFQWIISGLAHDLVCEETSPLWADHAVVVSAGTWQCGTACTVAQQRGSKPGGETWGLC